MAEKDPPIDTGAAYKEVSVSGLFGNSTPDAEKPAMKSKKFVAFIITEMQLFGLLMYMLAKQDITQIATNAAFMAIVFVVGFLAAAYIGGQALVDRYIRVAKINKMGHSGENLPPKESKKR